MLQEGSGPANRDIRREIPYLKEGHDPILLSGSGDVGEEPAASGDAVEGAGGNACLTKKAKIVVRIPGIALNKGVMLFAFRCFSKRYTLQEVRENQGG